MVVHLAERAWLKFSAQEKMADGRRMEERNEKEVVEEEEEEEEEENRK